MSDAAAEKGRGNPPYIPYRTFLNSLEVFDAHGLPPKVDRGIWKTQPGGTQGQLHSAYKFFGLIDDSGSPSAALGKLIADKDHRTEKIAALLHFAYPEILGKHDLSKMTSKMLDDEFESTYGLQSDMKRKSITFFLQAAKHSQMPLSGFLQSQVRVVRKARRSNGKQVADRASDAEFTRASHRSDEGVGSSFMPIPLGLNRIARIELPDDWNPQKDLPRLIQMLQLSLSEE